MIEDYGSAEDMGQYDRASGGETLCAATVEGVHIRKADLDELGEDDDEDDEGQDDSESFHLGFLRKEKETKALVKKIFKNGVSSLNESDVSKIIPTFHPIFGAGSVAKAKQFVIEKLQEFYLKYMD